MNPYNVNSKEAEPITKEEILSKIKQENIFSYYLSIDPYKKGKFRAPEVLRNDRHPTCTLKWIRGKLLYRDWAESKPYDCFQIVMKVKSCDFKNALKIIAKDFGIRRVNGIKKGVVPVCKIERNSMPKTRGYSQIRVKRQYFTDIDYDYLVKKHQISEETLSKFSVSSAKYIWLNDKCIYSYKDNDPALIYHFGAYHYKIYFYKRDIKRFLSNTSRIQGVKQLPDYGDLLIITKSLKDVMVLHEAGIPAIAPQSENQIISRHKIDLLRKRFNYLLILFDFDYTGITSANKYRRLYGIKPLFLTDGSFKTLDYNAKDVADFVGKNSIEELKNLSDEIRKEYEENNGIIYI